MIDIDLIIRIIQKKGDDVDFEDKVKGNIKIEKPKSYDELISQIQKGFNLSSNDLAIVGIDEDEDEDEFNIKNEEDYEENKGSCNKYRVILENENEPNQKSGPVPGEDNINEPVDIEFDLESNLLNDEKELKDLLDKTMKKLETNNSNIEFDESLFKELDEKQSGEQNELYNYFLSNLNEKISDKNEAQKKSFLETITKEFLSMDKEINDKVEEIKSNTNTYFGDSKDVLKDLNEMKNNIPLIEDPSKILHPGSKTKPEPVKPEPVKPEQVKPEKVKPEPVKPEPINLEPTAPTIIEPEKIEINSEKNEYEFKKEEVNESISVKIKIKNISNKKICLKDKRIFLRDNSKKEIEVKSDLNINEEMDNNNNEKEIKVEIPMIQPIQKSYEYELYIKSSNKEEMITDKPFCFKITIKEEERPNNPNNPNNPVSKEEEDAIYNQLNDEFVVSNFMDEDELRAKIQEYRGNIEEIKKFVEEQI